MVEKVAPFTVNEVEAVASYTEPDVVEFAELRRSPKKRQVSLIGVVKHVSFCFSSCF